MRKYAKIYYVTSFFCMVEQISNIHKIVKTFQLQK